MLWIPLAVTAFGVAPPPSPHVQAIFRLIDDLAARDPRVRDLAEKQLIERAPASLRLVRAALTHRNAEVRRRALLLVPELENAVVFAPRQVTLSVRDQPLNKVLEALSKASGYNLRFQGFQVLAGNGKEKTFRYDFVNEPFWDVVDRICRDANLTPQMQHWGDESIWLHSASSHPAHVGRYGPFRYTASNFQLHRTVDLGPARNRSESLTFNFNVLAEPRLSFASAQVPRLESAYDNLRNSLLVRSTPFAGPTGSPPSLSGGVRSFNMSVSVNLERRSPKATMMTVLRGVIPVTIQAKQREIVLSDKILEAKGKGIEVEGLEFRINEVAKQPNQLRVGLTVQSKADDLSALRMLYYRVVLYDEKGQKISWNSASSHHSSRNAGATMNYPLPGAKPPTPTKLVFLHWETRPLLIPFEFRNVPLP
jgi:hypothetical protein